jgi:hypothetical protein
MNSRTGASHPKRTPWSQLTTIITILDWAWLTGARLSRGAGIKGGVSYGQSDEWSWKAAENATASHDLHGTILHLMGIDHQKLTYRHNGIDRRLTDVHGQVIQEVLA